MNDTSNSLKTFAIDNAIANIPKRKRRTSINISRKGSIIRERCNQIMEVAYGLGYHAQILDEDLTDILKMYVGGNRDTIRDYKGYAGRVVHGRAGSYVVGIRREGYLTLFGYAKRLNSRQNQQTWILNHKLVPLPYHYIEKLKVPEGVKANNTYDECSKPNMEEVSLTNHHLGLGENRMATSLKGSPERTRQDDETIGNNNNNTTPRERNLLHAQLTPEAEALLRAIPLTSEPDRAKTNLRECRE